MTPTKTTRELQPGDVIIRGHGLGVGRVASVDAEGDWNYRNEPLYIVRFDRVRESRYSNVNGDFARGERPGNTFRGDDRHELAPA